MDGGSTYDGLNLIATWRAFAPADRPTMRLPSLNFLSFESRSTNSLSLPLFTIFIALHPLAAFAVIAYFFPDTWAQQKSAGARTIVLTMIGCNLVYCFGEYLFHRYLLHANTVSLLTKLSFSHLAHHKLTSIRFTDDKVQSEYPISAPG